MGLGPVGSGPDTKVHIARRLRRDPDLVPPPCPGGVGCRWVSPAFLLLASLFAFPVRLPSS